MQSMIRAVFLFLLFGVSSAAYGNPFEPSIGEVIGEQIGNAVRAAGQLAASKAEATARISVARSKYFRSYPDKEGVEEAEAVLTRQSQVNPNDVDVWYELAETAGLAGNITGVHLARADFFYLHGSYHRAIQHLEYAQRLVRRTNPQLQAKLSQRIQDMAEIVAAPDLRTDRPGGRLERTKDRLLAGDTPAPPGATRRRG